MNLLLIVLLLVLLVRLLMHAKNRLLLWLRVYHLHILLHLRMMFTWFLLLMLGLHRIRIASSLRESHADWTSLLDQVILLVRALAYGTRIGRTAQFR